LLGVDVFFVLSGFLITRLLLAEHRRNGRISLGQFWLRRARRLVPALLVMLIGIAAFATWVASPGSLGRLRIDALSTLGYVANWRFSFSHQGYFEQFQAPSPLLHTWSLAVEEQFYLIWPLIAVFAIRRWNGQGRPRRLFLVASIGALASAGVCLALALHGTDTSRMYYGTDTRAEALLVGAALACLSAGTWRPGVHARDRVSRERVSRLLLGLVGIAGAVVVVWCFLRVNGQSGALYRGGFFGIALATAAMVAAVVAQPRSPLAQLFSLPPLRYLGRISYGVYLYHWPLFLVLTRSRVGVSGWALVGVRVGVTLAVAVTSFHLIERPIRQGQFRMWRPQVLAPASALTAVAAVATVLVVTTNLSSAGSAGAMDSSTLNKLAQQVNTDQKSQTAPGATAAPAKAIGSTSTRPSRIMLVGDSVALTLGGTSTGGGLTQLAPQYGGVVINHGWVGCGIARNSNAFDGDKTYPSWSDCNHWDQVRQQQVNQDNPDVTAVLVGLWEMLDRKVDGHTYHLGMPQYDTYIGQELDTMIRITSAKGGRVALLSPPCFDHPDTASGAQYPANSTARLNRFHQLLNAAAQRSNGVATVIDLNPVMCPNGHFLWKQDGKPLRMDDGIHFTPAGVSLIAPTLMPQLVRLGQLRGVDLRTVPTGSLRPRPTS
jgi:peptidoglycan/LPS O-acetylase OafA/YrhL/lysophospholipase L1-like esterase